MIGPVLAAMISWKKEQRRAEANAPRREAATPSLNKAPLPSTGEGTKP
jgi:hypothetical protein